MKNKNIVLSDNKLVKPKLEGHLEGLGEKTDYTARIDMINKYRRAVQLDFQRAPDLEILQFCSTNTIYNQIIPDDIRFIRFGVSTGVLYLSFTAESITVPTVSGQQETGCIMNNNMFYLVDNIKRFTMRTSVNLVCSIAFYRDL